MRRCPECGLVQLVQPPPKPDRTLGAVALASWVPWASALLVTCSGSLLAFFLDPLGEVAIVVFWTGVGVFGVLVLFLAYRALRIAWIDAPRGKGWIDCIGAVPLLLLGHVCAAIAVLVAFLMLYGVLIAVGSTLSL
jgi:hypothetical protein